MTTEDNDSSEAAREQAKGEIDLLLEEYRTLREEVLRRVADRAAVLGLSVAAGALLLNKWDARDWALIVATAIAFGAFLLWTFRRLIKLSDRLATLEYALNERAHTAYSSTQALFEWETGRRTRRWWIARHEPPRPLSNCTPP